MKFFTVFFTIFNIGAAIPIPDANSKILLGVNIAIQIHDDHANNLQCPSPSGASFFGQQCPAI